MIALFPYHDDRLKDAQKKSFISYNNKQHRFDVWVYQGVLECLIKIL
jgi:hypothetical protein